jgi:hypothetical protein
LYAGWNLGTSTGSSGTGPQSGDVTGGSFVFIETSSANGGPFTLTSECLDISALGNPALVFSYHMYGATMGTLDVSINGNNEWTMSGDQGSAWHQAQVDLSAYMGSNIVIEFTGTRGTSYTGDIALDAIQVDEGSSSGCTDPLACNYDPSAAIDDGSCYNLTASVSATDVSCNGGADGSATASANVAGASYYWDNGANGASISGLAPGTYSVTVEDAMGCMVTASATVGEPAVLSASLSVGNESAAGAADGQIDLSVSGGVACVTSSSLSSWNSLHSSNASNGVHFNIVNNHSGSLTITGFSQGSLGSYTGANNMSAYYMPAAYDHLTAAGSWTQVANAVAITVPTGGSVATPAYSAPFAITPVTIPAGATYGFYVGGSSTIQYSTATASGP